MSSLGQALLNDVLSAVEADPTLATRLRGVLGAIAPAEWLDRARVEAEFPIRFRVLTDAARRGRIELGGTKRKPLVRRTELERFLSERRGRARTTTSTADEARAVLEASARRLQQQR